MIRSIRSRESGFTLIEVMVAALILLLAFTALAAIFISGQSQASADVQEAQLINIADQQMEQIRSAVSTQGFNALGMGGTSPSQLSNRVVRSTFFDPDSFIVSGTTAKCYLISTNYNSVTPSAASATPAYGVSAPNGFYQWSACGSTSNAEPLQTLTGSSPAPIVNWTSASVPQCSTSTGGSITVPCWVGLTSSCSSSATSITTEPSCAVTVYAFVSDTFVGCGTTGGVSCPSTSGGVVQCTGANLATTTAASTGCSDARRVTVAVVPNPPDQSNPSVSRQLQRITPVYLSTVFTNPTPSSSNSSSAGLTLNLSVL